jgi:hypothetical protein
MNTNIESPLSALQRSLSSGISNFIESKPYNYSDIFLKFTVVRYEGYPNEPSKLVVGFRLQNIRNGKTEYLTTILSTEDIDGKSESEILDVAYGKLKHQVDAFKKNPSSVIGKEYVPDKMP